MSGSTRDYYDTLTDSYHLIGVNWDLVMREQGKVLSSLIAKLLRVGGGVRDRGVHGVSNGV